MEFPTATNHTNTHCQVTEQTIARVREEGKEQRNTGRMEGQMDYEKSVHKQEHKKETQKKGITT